MCVFAYYCTLHLTFLSLHNCLAISSRAQSELIFKRPHMSRCPLYSFGILLTIIMIIVIYICVASAAQLNFWVTGSWAMFALVHLATMDTATQLMLYATCATVQGIKIKNFFSVTERRWLRPLAWIGLLFSTIIMALFISHMVFLIWYPGKKALAVLGITSLIWSSCLMLPLLHYMVLKHSRHVPDAEDLMESQRNSFRVDYSPSTNDSPVNKGSNALW